MFLKARADVPGGLFPRLAIPQEVSVCSYLVQVCSRLLCPALAEGVQEEVVPHQRVPDLGKKSPDAVGVASPRATAGGVLDVLKELEACFPVK